MKLKYVLLALAALSLAECSVPATPGGGATTVPVSLANAQAEAKAIMAALEADAPALLATLPPNIQDRVKLALSALDAATTAFLSVPTNDPTMAAKATAVIQAIGGVAALLPLPPQVQAGILAGQILLTGLVNALPSVTVTTPPMSMSARHAPIPIPK